MRRARWRRFVRHARRRVGRVLVPPLAPGLLRWLARSWSMQVAGEQNLGGMRADQGRLLALWHGRMLIGMRRHADLGYSVLVSPSEDGSLVKPLLERFGFRVIRGSSSRQGARAMRAMLRELSAQGTIVITPDGPRGPRHAMNQGLAWMARATGFPVIPLGFATDRAWRLRSWDAFCIPRWRARVALVYGEPILVQRTGGEEALERATRDIGVALMRAERAASALLDVPLDWAQGEDPWG